MKLEKALRRAEARIADLEAGNYPRRSEAQQARITARQIERLLQDPVAFFERHRIPVEDVADAIVRHVGGPQLLADYREVLRGRR
jgi:predicted neutral ceramidase superfamily lipid hydrolase